MKKNLVLGVIAIISGAILAACGADNGLLPARGCELTQALQGRWERECYQGSGETVAVVFDGDSVVEYSMVGFVSDRVLTQEDLDNNMPIERVCFSLSHPEWDNSGAVQRELISVEYQGSEPVGAVNMWSDDVPEMWSRYWVWVRERREGTFAVGGTIIWNWAEVDRIEILWNCDRGHEPSAIAVTVNQLGADTLGFGGRGSGLTRVEG